jgi:hypothetical protein
VTPCAFVPWSVAGAELLESCAATAGIKVWKRAIEETNAGAHDVENVGNRAIVEMVSKNLNISLLLKNPGDRPVDVGFADSEAR